MGHGRPPSGTPMSAMRVVRMGIRVVFVISWVSRQSAHEHGEDSMWRRGEHGSLPAALLLEPQPSIKGAAPLGEGNRLKQRPSA